MTTTQTWDPERYARNARYVADLATPVIELLAPRPGARILDLGCGDGALTERLAAAGCHVVGVDASAAQVAAARRRGLDARVMDGQRLAFDGEFDAVFSNSALHWMTHVDDVIAGVWRALRPGGRFVGECGGSGCIATIVAALYDALARRGIDGAHLNPWYFPTADDYGERLVARGFFVDSIALIPRPTPLPGDIAGWMETFAECFTAALAPAERSAFVDEVRETLGPKLCDADGRWAADYVLLRFAATKPDRVLDSARSLGEVSGSSPRGRGSSLGLTRLPQAWPLAAIGYGPSMLSRSARNTRRGARTTSGRTVQVSTGSCAS